MAKFNIYSYSFLDDNGKNIANKTIAIPVISESAYNKLYKSISGQQKIYSSALNLSDAGKLLVDTIQANKVPISLNINPKCTGLLLGAEYYVDNFFDNVNRTYFDKSWFDILDDLPFTRDKTNVKYYQIQNSAGEILANDYFYFNVYDYSLANYRDAPTYIFGNIALSTTSGTPSNSNTYFYGMIPVLIEENNEIIKFGAVPIRYFGNFIVSRPSLIQNIGFSNTLGTFLAHIIKGTPKVIDPTDTDPFTPGGTNGGGNSGGSGTSGGSDSSQPGGGKGDFNGDSDNVPNPSTRDDSTSDASVVNAGLISLYSPTQAQLTDLAQYLWSGAFSLDSFRKIFADPMDAILGLSIVPVAPSIASIRNVTIGNADTGIAMRIVSSQYAQVNCGSVTLNEYWGAFLDYSPYTKVTIYLPYIGTRQLDVDEIMKQTINVTYNIDLLSGACVCFIKAGDSVLYQFTGSVSTQIPITSISYNNMYKAMVDFASSVAIGVAVGSPTMSTLPTVTEGLGQTGPATPSDVIIPYAENYMSDSETVRTIMSMKPQVSKGGNIGSSAGQLAIQKPYLIVERPRQCVPKKQNTYTGYPSFQTKQVSSQSGYTTWATIHLESLTATADEKNEIGMIMKKGVIL